MQHSPNGAGVCTDSSPEFRDRRSYSARFDIAGRAVVVFGGGGAAIRHVGSLVHAGARVTVVSSHVEATIEDLAQRGLLLWRRRDFREQDLAGVWLAVAVTERPDLDGHIADRCDASRLWCLRDLEAAEVDRSGQGRVTLVVGGGSEIRG